MMRRARWMSLLVASLWAIGCDATLDQSSWDGADSGAASIAGVDAPTAQDTSEAQGGACPESLPYASEVVWFEPGADAGYGQLDMPSVVLGPPDNGPPTKGSLDVVSLGVGGEIVVGFGGRVIVDGPGVDFIVWENVFQIGDDPTNVFAELAEVAVSEDGETWAAFPCDPELEGTYAPGCAGWRPRQAFDACGIVPLRADAVGGDGFDLAELGLSRVQFVRLRDLSQVGGAPSAGFDLDAVGAVHLED